MTPHQHEPLDVAEVMSLPLHWDIDPEHFAWFRARYQGRTYHLRMNTSYPEVPLYSLLVDVDETVEFDDLPGMWTRASPLRWPDTAARE